MISEEMLSRAAGEVAAAMVNSVRPYEHSFSAGFERKMSALISKSRHPVRQQVLRYAAAVLIAVLTAFTGLYLLSPPVRAAVNGWVRTTFGSYFQYYTEDTSPPDTEYEYFLPEEFEGYRLVAQSERTFGTAYVYANDEGRILQFEYISSTESASLFLDVEDCTRRTVLIGTYTADLYVANSLDKNSVLVWEDKVTNTLLYICCKEEADEIIAIAEKIEKTEKNKKFFN